MPVRKLAVGYESLSSLSVQSQVRGKGLEKKAFINKHLFVYLLYVNI